MTPTLWISLVLGAGGLLGTFFTIITKIKDQKQDNLKKTGEIKLDQKEYERIAADAARINSAERIETERWWKEQFDAVKAELEEEQQWRRKMKRKLQLHKEWDEQQYTAAILRGEHPTHPPSLDPDEENGES